MNNAESRITLNIEKILLMMKECQDDTDRKITKFLKDHCINFSERKTEIYEKYDILNNDKFSILEELSPWFYWEDFSTDILKIIFDSNTKEIGRRFYLEEFVKFLELTKEEFDYTKEYQVSARRENKIDILIKNENQAIIIENKIYYARDMQNQLARYMQYVECELGIKNYTVVYMPLIDDWKKPPLGQYDSKFQPYVEKLKKELKIIYFVNEKKSIAKHFLPACIERINEEEKQNPNMKETCESARTFIKHYKIMLEHIGGKAYMMSTNVKLISDIYSDEKNFNAALDFWELWNTRYSCFSQVLKAKFEDEFKEPFPQVESAHGFNGLYLWKSQKVNYYIYTYENSINKGVAQVGFMTPDGVKFELEQQEELTKELNNIKIKNASPAKTENNEWIWREIYDGPTFFNDILNTIDFLRKNL